MENKGRRRGCDVRRMLRKGSDATEMTVFLSRIFHHLFTRNPAEFGCLPNFVRTYTKRAEQRPGPESGQASSFRECRTVISIYWREFWHF